MSITPTNALYPPPLYEVGDIVMAGTAKVELPDGETATITCVRGPYPVGTGLVQWYYDMVTMDAEILTSRWESNIAPVTQTTLKGILARS